MSKAIENQQKVRAFVDACKQHGFQWQVVSDSLVRISKRFPAGDKNEFSNADMVAGGILALAPLKGGSVWGTDGGSVGGMSGLNKGEYVLNKSGESGKRFLQLLKIMG